MLEVRDRLNFEDYLDSLLNSVESDDLEFKSAAGGFPGSFWDTYSAFANSEGGVIVLGVIERKGKFYIDKRVCHKPVTCPLLCNLWHKSIDSQSISKRRS